MANWQAAYTVAQDANSIQADPGFISTSDLHISVGSTTVNNVGTPIAGVTADFDGDTRNGTNPDLGADEYTPVVCLAANGGSISPSTVNRCDGQTYTMTSSGAEVGAGITYQWEISSTGGGVGFADVSGVPGAATASYSTAALTPGVYYYRLRVDCSNGPVTGYSNELALTVNANPSASIDLPVANYCNPNGVAVELNASGASNISWAPAAGLNTTTGATVSATPTANTTYTATVTDGNGCTATATSVITVQSGLTVSSITATPATVCNGDNSQLQVVAEVVGANTAAGTIYSAGTGSFETISSPNVLTVPTVGTADDGFEQVNTTGSFDFNYNGVNYDNFVISTNGYVVMGSTAPALNGIATTLTTTVLSSFNAVIGFGRDGNINVTNGGSINHGLDPTGTKYVFEYFNFAIASGGNESATQLANFQIVLWGNASTSPGRIDLIYGTSVGAPATNAALGLRDASATTAFKNALTGSSTTASTTATFPADQTMYTFERHTYTYAWTPSTFIAGQESLSNPLATGVTATTIYTVVAASASSGCSISSSVTVTVEPLNCSQATTSAATCENTNFTVTANHTGGGAPYSYSWDDGMGGVYPNAASITANLAAGTYTLTCSVSDACGSNCVSSTTVTVNALPNVTVTPNSGVICLPGGSAIALAAAGATTYAWTPADGLSATTGDNVTANPSGSRTYTVTGTDGNGCTNTANAVITVGGAISATASALPTSICEGDNAQLNVTVSPTPGAGAIKITEVTTFRTGTGATSPYPVFATGADLVEISNISSSSVDVSGWTVQDYANNTATVTHAGFAFPSGTVIPSGSVAIVHLGNGTDDIANRYFNTGGTNDVWLSTSAYGIVLKNGSSVIDAVGRGNPYVWNAGTGVTASDWSGNIATTSAAGIVRTAALDNNVGSDWVLSTITPATIGTFNTGYIPSVSIASYSWSPSAFIGGQEALQNPLATTMNASTTYSVVVTTTDGCTATGNATVTVTPLTSNTSSASACDTYTWSVNSTMYTSDLYIVNG
ncbi:MAG: lamin tail domain-containing protein [Bacteroidetes bacterium]|nr:lamin tail domain-containing protein [Bacteroidota bacterium]